MDNLQTAMVWALAQKDGDGNNITKNTTHALVDKVREYFNNNDVTYESFSFDDLITLFN